MLRVLVYLAAGALLGAALGIGVLLARPGLRPSTLVIRNETPHDIRVFTDTSITLQIPANTTTTLDAGSFSGRWLLPPSHLIVEGGVGKECTWEEAKRAEPLVVRDDSVNCGDGPYVAGATAAEAAR